MNTIQYDYQKIRPHLFTDEGQRLFLKVRDNVNRLLCDAGAVRLEEACLLGNTGDSWSMLACMDRLVELGEVREVPQPNVVAQHRIFVAP